MEAEKCSINSKKAEKDEKVNKEQFDKLKVNGKMIDLASHVNNTPNVNGLKPVVQ